MHPDQLAYYRQRAQVELSHAAEATNPNAKAIHEKLASLYVKLIELEQAGEPRLSIVGDRRTA